MAEQEKSTNPLTTSAPPPKTTSVKNTPKNKPQIK